MKTIETTFEPSKDGNVATGRIELCGTDKEIQSMLNSIRTVIEQCASDEYVVGEYVRVQDERCCEFCEILSVGIGTIEVTNKNGKSIDIPMSSVQTMGERRVLSLVGGRVPKDIAVGDLVRENALIYECTSIHGLDAILNLNGTWHAISILQFVAGDRVVLPNGLSATVVEYGNDDTVRVDNNSVYYEEELAPWDPIAAVQRYAASFGMKVDVGDVV